MAPSYRPQGLWAFLACFGLGCDVPSPGSGGGAPTPSPHASCEQRFTAPELRAACKEGEHLGRQSLALEDNPTLAILHLSNRCKENHPKAPDAQEACMHGGRLYLVVHAGRLP